MILDMDWHLTFYKNNSLDQANQPKGWTGYTWNRNLFPNPNAFLSHLHDQYDLHIGLNLHPASGIQPWEESYAAMAAAAGIDPTTKKYVPFDVTNKSFARAWLSSTLQPRMDEGVDFWWIDWQQGKLCRLSSLLFVVV
jgi:alpha-glucosidase